MTTTAQLVAAEHRRQQIPVRFQVDFEQITDAELVSIARDEGLSPRVRAYATWELEYRMVAGFEVFYDGELGAGELVANRLNGDPVIAYDTATTHDEIRRRKA